MQRVFICGIHQETASFNPIPSTWEDYTRRSAGTGQALIDSIRANGSARSSYNGSALGGMLDVTESRGYEAVGGMDIGANSGGAVQQSVVDRYLKENLALLREAMPVKAVLVCLHGATQSDASGDVCGDVLTAIRAEVGEDTVIAASAKLVDIVAIPYLDGNGR